MRIGPFDESQADGHLGAESNDRGGDVRIDKGGDGGMDIARIGGEEGAEKQQYLAGSM